MISSMMMMMMMDDGPCLSICSHPFLMLTHQHVCYIITVLIALSYHIDEMIHLTKSLFFLPVCYMHLPSTGQSISSMTSLS